MNMLLHRCTMYLVAFSNNSNTAGNSAEATGPFETSVTLASLECVMGHWNVTEFALSSSQQTRLTNLLVIGVLYYLILLIMFQAHYLFIYLLKHGTT